jgi:hypothetical protein
MSALSSTYKEEYGENTGKVFPVPQQHLAMEAYKGSAPTALPLGFKELLPVPYKSPWQGA